MPKYVILEVRQKLFAKASWLLLFCLVLTFYLYTKYCENIIFPFSVDRAAMTNNILSGQIESPYKYRLLVPMLLRFFQSVFGVDFLMADKIVSCLSLFFSLGSAVFLAFAVSRKFRNSLLTGFLCVFPWSSTFQFHGYQPWSFIEPFFLVLTLIAVWRRSVVIFLIATFFAVLNRETGIFFSIFAVPLFLSGREIVQLKDVLKIAVLGLFPLAVYALIRQILGWAPHIHDFNWLLTKNLENLDTILRVVFRYYHVFWLYVLVVVFRNLRYISFVLFSSVTLAFIIAFGLWNETRMLNTIATLIAIYAVVQIGDVEFSKVLDVFRKGWVGRKIG